jgi:hypothetical protein
LYAGDSPLDKPAPPIIGSASFHGFANRCKMLAAGVTLSWSPQAQ